MVVRCSACAFVCVAWSANCTPTILWGYLFLCSWPCAHHVQQTNSMRTVRGSWYNTTITCCLHACIIRWDEIYSEIALPKWVSMLKNMRCVHLFWPHCTGIHLRMVVAVCYSNASAHFLRRKELVPSSSTFPITDTLRVWYTTCVWRTAYTFSIHIRGLRYTSALIHQYLN
jgi:hypothetical protein